MKKKKKEEVNYEELLENESVVNTDFSFEIKDAILNYAIDVVTDRAIPDVHDGFKPVQRRILYAGLVKHYNSSNNYVKCARYVGDVMGIWHPHGL